MEKVTFWAATTLGWIGVEGEPVIIHNVPCVVHRCLGHMRQALWAVSEPSTGMTFGSPRRTKDAAIATAMKHKKFSNEPELRAVMRNVKTTPQYKAVGPKPRRKPTEDDLVNRSMEE